MEHIFYLWDRPIHMETWVDEKKVIFTFDGSGHTMTSCSDPSEENS
jgi:hypothetical protein